MVLNPCLLVAAACAVSLPPAIRRFADLGPACHLRLEIAVETTVPVGSPHGQAVEIDRAMRLGAGWATIG